MGGISGIGSLNASLRSAKCPVYRPDASVRAKRATLLPSNTSLTKWGTFYTTVILWYHIYGTLYKNPFVKCILSRFWAPNFYTFQDLGTLSTRYFFTKYQQYWLLFVLQLGITTKIGPFVSIHYNPIQWDTIQLHFHIVHVLLHYRLFWIGWKWIITRIIVLYSSFYICRRV